MAKTEGDWLDIPNGRIRQYEVYPFKMAVAEGEEIGKPIGNQ